MSKSHRSRVLITGSAGRLGRAAVRELTARGHEVVGYDLRPTPGLPAERSVVGDLSEVDKLHAAARGADCLIHLAATPDDARYPRGLPPDDGDNFLDQLVPNNVVGPYHVLEAARRLGIPRLLLASTSQVVDGHLRAGRVPVTPDSPPQPRFLYACTKVFLEMLGQVYAKEYGLSVLAVRLGWCPRDAGQVREIASTPRFQDVYFSPGDAGRFFAAAVETLSWPSFAVVYASSRPTHTPQHDLTATTRLLGWQPQDQWPTGADEG